MRSRSNSASRSTSAFLRAVKSANSSILAILVGSSFDELLDRRRSDLENIYIEKESDDFMHYRFGFFSRSRSVERDLCRFDELGMFRSRDDFRCLCFLFDGLRDRPIRRNLNKASKK